MEPTSPTTQQSSLATVRRRRAELRDAMSGLEHALAAPVPASDGRWSRRVHEALDELSADFADHVEITEGQDGLYQELLALAPRLADAVEHLTEEHGEIHAALGQLQVTLSAPEADLRQVRRQGTDLLLKLMRHRQRGSDLVYEAYEVDIGGDT